MTSDRLALWSIISVVLMGYIGIALPYPIFAPLFLGGDSNIASSTFLSPIMLFAVLMAIYPLGTLIGSLYLGMLSDRVGRKKVILISVGLAVVSNFYSGYAIYLEDYLQLFLSRFLTGVCEGNIIVARAVVTDLNFKQDKAVVFGYLSSAGYAGYLVGPLMGGLLAELHYSAPFILAALLCLLAAVACLFFLPETNPPARKKPTSQKIKLWDLPNIKLLLAIQFLVTFAINIYHEFLPALMVERWSASPIQIGVGTLVATVTMITLSVFGLEAILKRFSARDLYFSSMAMLGLSLVMFLLPDDLEVLYFIFVAFGISLALFNSNSNGWISNYYEHFAQGQLMGAVAATFFLSNIIAALLGGVIAAISLDFLIFFAGAISVLGALMFYSRLMKPA